MAIEIYKLANIIDRMFLEMFYFNESYNSETEYYPYRIFNDNTLIAIRERDRSFWKLTWSVDDNNVVTFSDKATWEKVAEEYIPTGEIGARNAVPYEKNVRTMERQKRYFAGAEARMVEGNENGIEGLGIVTNSRTLLFTTPQGRAIYEEIAPEAVANYDFSKADVISTFNHDFAKVLGRTSANTLVITKAADGLRYSVPSLPNTSYGNDLKEMLSRGDVKGSSFMFTIKEEKWTEIEGGMLRTILAFDEVYEVGPVTFPAYNDTTAAQRSLENLKITDLEIKEIQDTVKIDFSDYARKSRERKRKLRSF